MADEHEQGELFLVAYFFNGSHLSLHSTRAEAEACYTELLRDFIVEEGKPMPPREEWDDLCDDDGESVHLYRIECDGGFAELLSIEEAAIAA